MLMFRTEQDSSISALRGVAFGSRAARSLRPISTALAVIPSLHPPPAKRIRSARCRPLQLARWVSMPFFARQGWREPRHSRLPTPCALPTASRKPAAATACFVTAAAGSRLGPAGATDPVLRVSQVRESTGSDLVARPSLAHSRNRERSGRGLTVCFPSRLIKQGMYVCMYIHTYYGRASLCGVVSAMLPRPGCA